MFLGTAVLFHDVLSQLPIELWSQHATEQSLPVSKVWRNGDILPGGDCLLRARCMRWNLALWTPGDFYGHCLPLFEVFKAFAKPFDRLASLLFCLNNV